jgi:NTP pyrophosphatase (non-canonical NTP hydrolase)
MQLNDYQKTLDQFLVPTARNREYLAVGLGAEAGEVQSLLAKAVRDKNGEIDKEQLKKELGDVLFFVAALGSYYGIDLENIGISNINKLVDRKARNTIQGNGDNR